MVRDRDDDRPPPRESAGQGDLVPDPEKTPEKTPGRKGYLLEYDRALAAGLWLVAMIMAEVIGVLELVHWAGWL